MLRIHWKVLPQRHNGTKKNTGVRKTQFNLGDFVAKNQLLRNAS
jgi:hypothetical protein